MCGTPLGCNWATTLAPGVTDGDSDASFEAGRSNSGNSFILSNAAIALGMKKQQSFALSTCEAEIMAGSLASCEAVYLRGLLTGLGFPPPGPTELRMDNSSAINLGHDPEQGIFIYNNRDFVFITPYTPSLFSARHEVKKELPVDCKRKTILLKQRAKDWQRKDRSSKQLQANRVQASLASLVAEASKDHVAALLQLQLLQLNTRAHIFVYTRLCLLLRHNEVIWHCIHQLLRQGRGHKLRMSR
eukprot:2350528-Pleurochrysis_carterae.AAC.1